MLHAIYFKELSHNGTKTKYSRCQLYCLCVLFEKGREKMYSVFNDQGSHLLGSLLPIIYVVEQVERKL